MQVAMARLRSNTFLRQGALVFAGSMFVNAAGFVFHMIASRTLGPAGYGTLYALLAAMALASGPAVIAMPVISRFAAEFRARDDRAHLRGLTVGLGRVGIVLALALVLAAGLASVPLGAFLHAPAWSIPLAALLMVATLASAAYRALAQGLHDFEGYAISAFVEGVTKIVATLAFAAIGWQLFGALGGFVVGSAAGTVLIVTRVLARTMQAPEEPVRYDWRRIAYATAGSAALAVGASLFGNVDVVIVKHAFDATQAGIYSAASLGGKIVLFGVGFVPAVLLPQATDRNARGERTSGVLFASCGVVLGLGGLALLVFHFFGPLLVRVLVGPAFAVPNALLIWYGAAMLCVALISALGSYGIAVHRLAFGWSVVAGSAGTWIALAVYHPSLDAVVHVLAGGAAVTALATAISIGVQSVRR
ncbi:MAG: oligosaccharide flippase family protein [Candidatus Eremiobacteraeota bacterium]|nr:oligosaccharide flippase family protein [Candidatus Eremiobacteraeota bacterium]